MDKTERSGILIQQVRCNALLSTEIPHQCLNLLKKLAHSLYGVHHTTLQRVYQAPIQSKIDYGAAIYSSSSKTTLKTLNLIYYSALSLATDTFPTTPGINLYPLAHKLSPPDLH